MITYFSQNQHRVRPTYRAINMRKNKTKHNTTQHNTTQHSTGKGDKKGLGHTLGDKNAKMCTKIGVMLFYVDIVNFCLIFNTFVTILKSVHTEGKKTLAELLSMAPVVQPLLIDPITDTQLVSNKDTGYSLHPPP